MSATDMLAVFTTVGDRPQADQLARAAVEQRLAACVHVEDINSTYRWEGEVISEAEVRVMFKTSRERYTALEALLRELHPYELPAIFALRVEEASAAYVAWLQSSLRSPTVDGH